MGKPAVVSDLVPAQMKLGFASCISSKENAADAKSRLFKMTTTAEG